MIVVPDARFMAAMMTALYLWATATTQRSLPTLALIHPV
jgi:hypothetical protein